MKAVTQTYKKIPEYSKVDALSELTFISSPSSMELLQIQVLSTFMLHPVKEPAYNMVVPQPNYKPGRIKDLA